MKKFKKLIPGTMVRDINDVEFILYSIPELVHGVGYVCRTNIFQNLVVADEKRNLLVTIVPLQRFAKEPKRGDKIKIYYGRDGVLGVDYGIATHIVIRGGKDRKRQVVAVNKCKPVPLHECDYFLDSDKVVVNETF